MLQSYLTYGSLLIALSLAVLLLCAYVVSSLVFRVYACVPVCLCALPQQGRSTEYCVSRPLSQCQKLFDGPPNQLNPHNDIIEM